MSDSKGIFIYHEFGRGIFGLSLGHSVGAPEGTHVIFGIFFDSLIRQVMTSAKKRDI